MLPVSRPGDKSWVRLSRRVEVGVDGWSRLRDTIARLRGDGGCPWDRAQTERTMQPYVLEEAHEVVEAIDRGDDEALRKEIGDLLFVTAMIARIAEERGAFDVDDAAAASAGKMISRHPHVFGGEGDGGTMRHWEGQKRKERPDGSSLDGVPTTLPALLRAHRVGEKASGVGFDWPDRHGVRTKVDEELAELDAAIASGDSQAIDEELGDVLFTMTNLGRHLGVPAEDALRRATAKFERRFRAVEAMARREGQRLEAMSAEALDAWWRAAKAEEA
jgi:MazG family protein